MRGHNTIPGPARPSARRRAFFAGQKFLGFSRIGDLYGSRGGAGHAIVLMYHSVCPPGHERWIAPRNRISVELFERQLRRLAASGRMISVSQLADAAVDEPVPDGSVALTFDDGYLDTLTMAAPLLQKYQVPATLYLATQYVANAESQWADVLYSTFRHRERDKLTVELIGSFDLRKKDQREAALYELGRHLASATREQRTRLLDEVRSQLGSPRCGTRLTLDFDDVRRLKAEYPMIQLGVHTADHLDLTAMDTDGALAEVRRSMDDFRTELGCGAEHFSYPYGRWTPESQRRMSATGLRTAMTGQGIVSLDHLDPFDLRRLEAPESISLFRYWTSGAHPSLTRNIFGRS